MPAQLTSFPPVFSRWWNPLQSPSDTGLLLCIYSVRHISISNFQTILPGGKVHTFLLKTNPRYFRHLDLLGSLKTFHQWGLAHQLVLSFLRPSHWHNQPLSPEGFSQMVRMEVGACSYHVLHYTCSCTAACAFHKQLSLTRCAFAALPWH